MRETHCEALGATPFTLVFCHSYMHQLNKGICSEHSADTSGRLLKAKILEKLNVVFSFWNDLFFLTKFVACSSNKII